MNLDNVQTFLEIAACSSFNKAAERLHVTQSTVSARINNLEAQLGSELFTRNHTGVYLTVAGEKFYRYALTLSRAWKQAKGEIALPEGFRASFGLGVQINEWDLLTTHWIPWMRKHSSGVALTVEFDFSNNVFGHLLSGLMDVGIVYDYKFVSGLIVEQLFVDKLILVSTERRDPDPRGHKDYVMVQWEPDVLDQYQNAFPNLGMPQVTINYWPVALKHILINGGAGYFPLRAVRQHVKRKALYCLDSEPVFERPVYVIFSDNPKDTDLQNTALDGLRKIARRESSRTL